MKRIIPVILVLLSVVTTTLGTPQAGTPLRINGTNYYVHGFTLRPDMQETFHRNRDRLTVISSANWKGYYVDLEMRGKQLYLTSLDIERGDGWFQRGPSVRKMFGTTVPMGGIFAEWFTGELEEPVGEPLIFYTTITEYIRVHACPK